MSPTSSVNCDTSSLPFLLSLQETAVRETSITASVSNFIDFISYCWLDERKVRLPKHPNFRQYYYENVKPKLTSGKPKLMIWKHTLKAESEGYFPVK